MYITPTTYTVADYCAAMERKEIVVNREYQRSDRVWPPAAKSFLIESILLNYPIPKLSLYQVTDIKSRRTYKEIVDGQQRSQAILEFYNDEYKLSRALELPEVAGKSYSQLDPEYQHKFLDYSLSFDLFLSANADEIREVFRRINSYTVPLNPEEKRHSMYQGQFKWFIYRLSKRYDQNFIDMKVFSERQLLRMADAKLFTETTHALFYGITKTNPTMLDKLYKDYDNNFPQEEELQNRFDQSMEQLLDLRELHRTAIMKPYNIYSLILALIHFRHPYEKLLKIYNPPQPHVFERSTVLTNLTTISDALENSTDKRYREFIEANTSNTNSQGSRTTRFKWFCEALQPQLI